MYTNVFNTSICFNHDVFAVLLQKNIFITIKQA